MAMFGGPEPEPVVAGPGDVRRLAVLLDRFERAVGEDAALRRAAAAIAHAGAGPVAGPPDPDRPWRWLAAAVERAAAQDEPALVGRAYLFVDFWTRCVAPHLGPADRAEIGLDRPAPATGARLAVAGFAALRGLPGDDVLVAHPSGVIVAATMAIAAAVRIVTSTGEGVPDSAVAAAREWLDAFRKG